MARSYVRTTTHLERAGSRIAHAAMVSSDGVDDALMNLSLSPSVRLVPPPGSAMITRKNDLRKALLLAALTF